MKCKAKNRRGAPCAMPPRASGYCFAHDPAMKQERDEARVAGGQARQAEPPDLADGQRELIEDSALMTVDEIEGALGEVARRVAVGQMTAREANAAVSALRGLLRSVSDRQRRRGY